MDDVVDRGAGDMLPAAHPGEMDAGVAARGRPREAERVAEVAADLLDRQPGQPGTAAIGTDETADIMTARDQLRTTRDPINPVLPVTSIFMIIPGSCLLRRYDFSRVVAWSS